MLEIKLIRQNLAAVEAALATRGQSADLEAFKTVDAQHRQTLQEVEELRHRRNVVSDEIARLKRAGDPHDIALAVRFFAMDTHFVTGQILAVDGGRSAKL